MLYLTNQNETSLDSFQRFNTDNWEEIKQRITCKLTNKKIFNATYKDNNIIYSNHLDLTAVYIVSELSQDRKHIISYVLKYDDIKKFGVTEEEVKISAYQNLEHDMNKRIKPLRNDAISQNPLYPLMHFPKESTLMSEDHMFVEDISNGKENILTVTNKYNVFGASYILDHNTLRELHYRIQDNFYIVPLSVHKLMCISSKYIMKGKSMYEAEDDLLDMLFEMNQSNKNTEDILSYHIYKYLADDGEVLFPIKQKL